MCRGSDCCLATVSGRHGRKHRRQCGPSQIVGAPGPPMGIEMRLTGDGTQFDIVVKGTSAGCGG